MFEISTYLTLFFFGLYGTWRNWKEFKRAYASTTWAHTSGVILYSKLQTSIDEERYESQRGVILYQYEINGTFYRNKRVFYGDEIALQWRKPIQKSLEAYPVGKIVAVTYNPDAPSSPVLEPGVKSATYLALLAPAAMVVWTLIEILFTI